MFLFKKKVNRKEFELKTTNLKSDIPKIHKAGIKQNIMLEAFLFKKKGTHIWNIIGCKIAHDDILMAFSSILLHVIGKKNIQHLKLLDGRVCCRACR